ncbi:AAA family ATPase [Mesorhizobium sp. YR577]|uniref:AAA family ATPase n=1 Tax=Mesorhizobium sp. YR577 TaxID=1884373 RepID=UPI0008E9335B|nr:AAA family ATPase [Mesorhizobium sp. YR577]SFU03201.1 Predicted ATPase [Mesorhizobium sp. YR577]
MQTDCDRFFILTGGPGSGKTTLIEALRTAGYPSSVEAGRGIIQDQMAVSGPALPWNDPALFAELMLSWEMRSHAIAIQETGPVFFDRGVPDVIGYLRLTGLPVPAHIEKAAEVFRYNRKVFILPPWAEIFHQDAERKQDLDEARRTYEAMVETYTDHGYELITVPPAPVQERLSFVLAEAGF